MTDPVTRGLLEAVAHSKGEKLPGVRVTHFITKPGEIAMPYRVNVNYADDSTESFTHFPSFENVIAFITGDVQENDLYFKPDNDRGGVKSISIEFPAEHQVFRVVEDVSGEHKRNGVEGDLKGLMSDA